jgi:hypothetical protein
MTSRLIPDTDQERPDAPLPSPDGDAKAAAAAPQADTPQAGPSTETAQETPQETPHVASPPTSPWWTAPAGKPVDIPAFGRAMIDTFASLVSPAPRPVPIRVRPRR